MKKKAFAAALALATALAAPASAATSVTIGISGWTGFAPLTLAKANGIRVVLGSVLPAFDFPWRRGLEPAPKIVALNKWIQSYADRAGAVYADFHTPMADERQGLRADLSKDGVHPTPAGYAVMAPIVERAIAQALARR